MTFLCSILNLFLYLPLPLTKVAAKKGRDTCPRFASEKSEIICLLSLLKTLNKLDQFSLKEDVNFSLSSDAVELFKHESWIPLAKVNINYVGNTKLSTHAPTKLSTGCPLQLCFHIGLLALALVARTSSYMVAGKQQPFWESCSHFEWKPATQAYHWSIPVSLLFHFATREIRPCLLTHAKAVSIPFFNLLGSRECCDHDSKGINLLLSAFVKQLKASVKTVILIPIK